MGIPVGKALGVMVRLRLMATALFLALVAAAYGVWALVHGPGFTDATTPRVMAAAVLLQMLSGSRQLLLDTWIGEQRVNRVETLRLLDTGITLLLMANACLLVAALDGHWSPLPGLGRAWARALHLTGVLSPEQEALLLTGSYVVAKAATLLAASAIWLRDRVPLGGWDRALAASYARFAIPVALTGALALVLQYTDTILLGFFWTAHEVGLYGAAQKLSGLTGLLGAAVGSVLFSRFAQLHARGDHAQEEHTFRSAERYLFLLTVPAAAALVALPRQGLHVAVGDGYLGAAAALRSLALAAVLLGLTQPMANRLLGRGRTGLLVGEAVLNCGSNLLLNLWFIPRGHGGLGLGAEGAGLATLCSTFVSYLYLRWRCRQLFGTRLLGASHARIVLAGAGVGVAWWWLARVAPGLFVRAWELVGWGVLGLLAYAAVLLLLREVGPEDKAFLRRAAHPSALLAELRGR
jgi:peptidoglycan biosynthesis protein MviN/MurJ (putative lipid II flippase)